MTGARLPVLDALNAAVRQTSDKRMKAVIESVVLEVTRGKTLSAALEAQGSVFDPLFLQLVQVGESSGLLDGMLERIAAYLEKSAWLRRKVLTALTYPAVVLTAATGGVAFLIAFIVPTFADMFADFGAELPAATKFVMAVSDFAGTYGLFGILLAAGTLLAARRALRRESIRRRFDTAMFHVPFVGSMLRRVAVARFCRTLGTLLTSGVRLVDALRILASTTRNAPVRELAEEMIVTITRGDRLARTFTTSSIFPPMVIQMITVGEEAGRLDEILLHTAEHFEKEVDGQVDALASVIEPVLILMLGLVVGGILISMYLPLFSLMDVVR